MILSVTHLEVSLSTVIFVKMSNMILSVTHLEVCNTEGLVFTAYN